MIKATVRASRSGRVLAGTAALLLCGIAAGLTGCGDSSAPEAKAKPTTTTATAAAAPKSDPSAKGEAQFVMPADAGPADTAWAAIEEAFRNPPRPPEAWMTTPPTPEAVKAFQKSRGQAAEKLAEQVKDFYTKFPNDSRVGQAHEQEMQLLDAAFRLGSTNVLSRLETLEKARLDDPKTPEEERFALSFAAAQRAALAIGEAKGEAAGRAAMEESARKLITQFPKSPEPYQLLLGLAADGPPEKARATATSLSGPEVPEPVREAAAALLKKLDLVGKPLDLKFTAVDGREVDLAQLKGKVVLVDFWATWCGPCIRELPNVKAAYSKLKPMGFEILGISFDEDKEALTKLVAREGMTWPQYFDGKGWQNVHGRRFGIDGIPAMWLVDKQGVLRDLEGREDLEEKVTKLLAEGESSKTDK